MMGYLQWMLPEFYQYGVKKMKQENVNNNISTLLTDLKSCRMRRDLEWGRRIHAEAVERQHDSNIYVVTALIRMYAKCGSLVDARCMFDSTHNPDVVCWTALLQGYAENGEGFVTLELFLRMKAFGCAPNSVTYVAALKACTSLARKRGTDGHNECLKRGRQIHSEVGCNLDIFVQSTLIYMYSKCGSMMEARRAFDIIQNPNVVSWNSLLMGYAENGDGLTTLELFSKMKACGWLPDSVTYIAVFKACTSLGEKQDGSGKCEWLKWGKEIHSEIGCDLCDIFVQNTLIAMYAKCGSMVDARCVFDAIQRPCVVSWNALLLGYAEDGDGLAALKLFSKMKACGCQPDFVSFIAALKACMSSVGKWGQGECLKRGREIHSDIGYDLDIVLQNTLISMYSKCGSIVEAGVVFDSIQKPDVVSWNALLLGYVENGEGLASLDLLSRMKVCKCPPDSVTYISALKACISMAEKRIGGGHAECLKLGKQIHSEIDCDLNVFLKNTLIDMYAKCSSMVEARRVFDSIQKPDVVAWNSLLLGYVENGDGFTTLKLFSEMKASGCVPNSITYVAALKSCATLAEKPDGSGPAECLKRGKNIHSEIGKDSNIFVQNTLIDMYAKCGNMFEARQVFDSIQKPDVVSWNALLLGYVENREENATLELFWKMKCAPNSLTYVAALKACALIGALSLGRKLHSEMSEFTAQIVTCLVDFYVKCGCIVDAQQVFDAHSKARDVSTWTALLKGYGSFGDTISVFRLFEGMQDQGLKPDGITFVCILSCCSHAGLVEKAREYFKAMPVQYGVTPTAMHYTCMIDVLGRANQLNEAITVLRKMPCNPNAFTWMTLLGACHKWKNVEIGRYVFQSLIDVDKKNAAAYTLMANIYGSRGMWEEQERVLQTRTRLGIPELPVVQGVQNDI